MSWNPLSSAFWWPIPPAPPLPPQPSPLEREVKAKRVALAKRHTRVADAPPLTLHLEKTPSIAPRVIRVLAAPPPPADPRSSPEEFKRQILEKLRDFAAQGTDFSQFD